MFEGLLTGKVLAKAWRFVTKNGRHLYCSCRGYAHWNTPIRVSCAYLIRIQFGNKFLLVPSTRIPSQMQPPGGVVKVTTNGESFLRSIGAFRGDDYTFDDKNDAGDLRIRVPGKNLRKFLKWYAIGEGREREPHREFAEELIETDILRRDVFGQPGQVVFEPSKTVFRGPGYSRHFKCSSLLIHEVFHLVDLTEEQTVLLKELQAPKNCGERVGVKAKFGWYTSSEIASDGKFPDAGMQKWKVGDHAGWMI